MTWLLEGTNGRVDAAWTVIDTYPSDADCAMAIIANRGRFARLRWTPVSMEQVRVEHIRNTARRLREGRP